MKGFNKAKPCHILYVENPDDPMVLNGTDGQPLMFKNYATAKRHAMKVFDDKIREHLRFINIIASH